MQPVSKTFQDQASLRTTKDLAVPAPLQALAESVAAKSGTAVLSSEGPP